MKHFSLALLSLVLMACSTKSLTETEKAEVNDIAVVTFLDNKMPVTYIGSTLFNNEKTDVKVTKWKLNDVLKQAMLKETTRAGRRYIELPIDLKEIKAITKKNKHPTLRLMDQHDNEVNAYLLKQAAKKGVKYLWVIRPAAHPYYPEQTGYGLFCRAHLTVDSEWHSYLSFQAVLWDVQGDTKVYQGGINPEVMKTKSADACKTVKGSEAIKFAERFKEPVTKMLQNSAGMLYQWAGLAPEPKS